jgi:acid phosphatase type 7
MSIFRSMFLVLLLAAPVLLVAGITRGPYLTCVTEHSVTIRWTTEDPTHAKVVYGTNALTMTVRDSIVRRVHTVVLTDLLASTAYRYRAIAGRDSTTTHLFATAVPPGQPFVFGAYGDTRGGTAEQDSEHVRVLRIMEGHGARFAIHTGDLVFKNDPAYWDEYYACTSTATSFACDVPIFSTVGNHENGRMYYDELVLPKNAMGNSHYYSFDYGSVHFIAINSRENCEDPTSEQYRWIREDLASPAARRAAFRVAFFHDPPYCSRGEHESSYSIRETLCPLLEAAKVDLVVNGHNHFYERSNPINGITYVVAGAAGAPLYDFHSTETFTAYRESVPHGCVVTVSGDTLRMIMIREDGRVRDSLTIASRTPQR